jgi:hypothetical protein
MADAPDALREIAVKYLRVANRRSPPNEYLLGMAMHYERLAAAAEEAHGGNKPSVATLASHDQIAVEKKLPPPKLG